MTKTPTPGEQFHFLKSMAFPTDLTSSGGGTVSRRGQVATVTEKLLEAGRDRNGDCWLDLLHYPEKQEARWGSVVIVPGLPDKDFDYFEKGSVEEDMAREAAEPPQQRFLTPQNASERSPQSPASSASNPAKSASRSTAGVSREQPEQVHPVQGACLAVLAGAGHPSRT